MSHHIFLSPHLDDVSLSCGGTLHHLVDQGQDVQVITIFAGIPDPDTAFSAFAEYQHSMWGNLDQAYAARRQEDRAALAGLGLTPMWLDFLDCIYRGEPARDLWYYNSDPDIFGAVHPAELETADQIAQTVHTSLADRSKASEIRQPELFTIYAPLTVGGHVDHQLTFLAALSLRRRGYPLLFYEEYPYADRDPQNVTVALQQTTPALLKQALADGLLSADEARESTWDNTVIAFSEAALRAKIEAIATYATQLEVLFGGKQAMIERVQAYTRLIGQGAPAERFWRLSVGASQ